MSQNLVIQAGYLDVSIPQQFITLRNTLGLPGLPFCWLPFPLQQRLEGYDTRQTSPSPASGQ